MIRPPAPLPCELRIGVTGHRNLNNPGQIADAVDKLLDHIQCTFELATTSPFGPTGPDQTWSQRIDTALTRIAGLAWRTIPLNRQNVPVELRTPIRWSIISPLAKGADQVVANQVLARTQNVGKPRLQVVMPFSLNEYRRDFVDDNDRQEFERLLAFDPDFIVLQPDYVNRVAGLSADETSVARNAAYRAAGHWVVDSCEILIAVWDGEQAAGLGGTGDVLGYALEQQRVVLWIDSKSPSRPPVMLIANEPKITKRHSGEVPSFREHPIPRRAIDFSSDFHQLATYNCDPAFDHVEYTKCSQRVTGEIHRIANAVQLPLEVLTVPIGRSLGHYARADQIAIRYQSLYAFAATLLHVLAASAVSIAVFQIFFFPDQVWLILFEILAMVSAVGLLRISKNEGWHEKWLSHRHLAEQIRIRFIAALAGVQRSTGSKINIVLPFYRSPDAWIRNALDLIVSEADFEQVRKGDFVSLKQFLVDGWIMNQAKYHQEKASHKHGGSHRAHRTGLILFLATLVMALLHYLHVGKTSHAEHGAGDGWLSLLISVAAILMPAWGAAVHAINTISENERIAERSRQMAQILTSIASRAEQATTIEELRVEIQRVEEVMLAESHDWWVTLSFRNLVLPT